MKLLVTCNGRTLTALGGVTSGAGTKDLCGLFRPRPPHGQDPSREQLSRRGEGLCHHESRMDQLCCEQEGGAVMCLAWAALA